MEKRTLRGLLLAVDVIALAAFILAAMMSANKPSIGAEWSAVSTTDNRPMVQHNLVRPAHALHDGDIIQRINGIPVNHIEDVELLVDAHRIGEPCNMTILRDGNTVEIKVVLSPYYSGRYLVIQYVTTFLFFLLAVFVGYQRPLELPARIFHHLGLSIGGIVMFTAGQYTMLPFYLGHILTALFPASFAFSAALLVHFSIAFPRPKNVPKWAIASIYGTVSIISLAGFISSLAATTSMDPEHAHVYFITLTAGKFILVIGALFAIGMFLRTHNHSTEIADRIQLKWVLFGTSLCIFTYVFLWQIPNSIVYRLTLPEQTIKLIRNMSVPEEVLILSVLFSASCMTVALLRFRAFDIEVIIRRSTLYGIVFTLLISVYVALLGLSWTFFDPRDDPTRYLMATAIMALNLLLFLPARGLVQRVLDKYFYRIRYNYRDAMKSYLDSIARCVSVIEVAKSIVVQTDTFFSPLRTGFLLVQDGTHLKILAHSNMKDLAGHIIPFADGVQNDSLRRPFAKKGAVEPDADCEFSSAPILNHWGGEVAFPLVNENGALLGIYVLGSKKSQYKYSSEDVTLLQQATRQAAQQISRIKLQQELWLEQQEADRLEELNELKSYFVSSVSHDLKTPITSVRIFSELLREQAPPDAPEADKYFGIIEGECERLTRLINNVLDYAKIEKGVKLYNFTPSNLNNIVQRVAVLTEYQVQMSGFDFETVLHDMPANVSLDEDAILQTLTNLITNSIKYSGDRKYIRVSTGTDESGVLVSVEDHGIGIDADDLRRVFEPYYRVQGGQTEKRSGTGLGLALVKHTMDAHGGSIDIKSIIGEGTTITLHFPLEAHHENNPHY